MVRNSHDERWSAINNRLAAGLRRQAIVRITNELPEGQGKAVSKQPPEVKVPQVQFVTQLIRARKVQHLSQTQLAAKIGSSQTTIARIEGGDMSPSLNMVFRIITALGLSWKLE